MIKYPFTRVAPIRALAYVILILMISLLFVGPNVPLNAASDASQFIVSGYPSPIAAGKPGSFTVTVQNASASIVADYTGTVHFTSSDSQAVLPADYTFTGSGGGKDNGTHTFTATLKTAGTQSITATDTITSSITGAQSGITVTAASASKFIVSGYPSPTIAGTQGSFTVIVQNTSASIVADYTGTVHFTSSDSQAVLPADYTFTGSGGGKDNGTHTFTATLKTAGTQSITATDTVTSSITGTQSGITVTAANASKFIVSGYPSPITAGMQGSFSVTAQDAYDNSATGYTGTVHFTSSDVEAALPFDYAFVGGDKGTHNFIATFNTAGTQSIAAADIAKSSITGAQSGITVNPPAPNSLPGTVDNSTSPAFPPIGDQTAGESSCVGWATTYYQFTYENDHIRNLDASGGDPNVIFSPKWTYNMINGGSNGETTLADAYALLRQNGAVSWAAFPYDGTDYLSWCLNTAAWRTAINFRAASWSTILASQHSDETIDYPGFINALKTQLNNGHVMAAVTYEHHWRTAQIGIDPVDPEGNKYAGQTIATYMYYPTSTPNDLHTMVIVGYDDNIWCDLNRNNKVDPGEKGAFKVANSRGTNWGNAGFMWVSYDALRNISGVASNGTVWPLADRDNGGIFSGLPDYKAAFYTLTANASSHTPKMYAVVTLNTTKRDHIAVSLGTSAVTATIPTSTWLSAALNYSGGDYDFDGTTNTPAPDGTFVFDFSDLAKSVSGNTRWFLDVTHNGSETVAVKSFELYQVTANGDAMVASCSSLPQNLGSESTTPHYYHIDYSYNPNQQFYTIGTTAGPGGTITPFSLVGGVGVKPGANQTFTITPNTGDSIADVQVDGQSVLSQLVNNTYTFNSVTANHTINATFNINASKFNVSGYPSPITAGVQGSFSVTAQDSTGITATNYSGTIHFTSSDSQAGLPADYTFASGDQGTHTFSSTLKTAGPQSITVTDTAPGSITGAQSGIAVTAANVSKFSVIGYPSSIAAGTPGSFSVTAQDASGNTVTGYRGVVHFTSSDSAATLPGDYTFVSGDNGTHTFSATLKTAGTQSITATDTVTGSVTGTQGNITVNPVAASQIRVETADNGSGTVVADQNVSAGNSVTVYAITRDQFDNFVANTAGTWSLINKAGGVADTDLVPAGDNKSAVFTGHLAGSAKIHVDSTGLTSTDSGKLSVVQGEAAKLSLTGYTSPSTAGISHDFTVTVQDSSGNTVTGYTGTVHFTSSDAQAALPTDYTFVSGDNGTHTFSATLKTAGTQSITATDTATASISGTQSGITVTAANISKLSVSGYPSPITMSTPGTFRVTAQDASGNTIAGYTGTVHFTSSDAQAALPTDYTFVSGDNGTHTFSATLKTTGTQSITATDTTTGSITGVQGDITVNAPAPVIVGGGGGGGGSSVLKLSISGFSTTTPLNISSNGIIQGAVQLQTKDGNATLNIGSGTRLLSNSGNPLSILTIDVMNPLPSSPAGNTLITAYTFGPDGSTFNPSLTLTLKYDATTLPAGASENDLYLASWDGKNWTNLESQVDAKAKAVSAQISHLSQYGLLIKLPSPARFALSDLKVIPVEVSPGNLLTIQANVSNTGGMSGQYVVNLKINGIDEAKQQVSLDAGQTGAVSFQVKKGLPGEYTFDVNGTAGKFKVVEASPLPGVSATPQVTVASAAANTPANTTAPPTSEASSQAKVTVPFIWLIVGVLAILGLIFLAVSRIRRST